MSRNHIWLIIGGYFLVALGFSAVLQRLEPFPQWDSLAIGRVIGSTLGLFFFSGILPLTWWAFGRFRAQKATSILTAWAVLGFLVGASFFHSQQQEVEKKVSQASDLLLPGKARDDFIRIGTRSCIEENRAAKINQQGGITESQIKIYCDCVTNALSKQISADELRAFVQSGNAPDGLREKADRIGQSCGRDSLSR